MRTAWVWRTVHINHVKPAKTPAGGFLSPWCLMQHLHRHPCTLRGIIHGVSLLLLLNQPPLPGNRLNQPPLSQSAPSPPLLPARPRLPRVGLPRAQQPMRIRPLALSKGQRPSGRANGNSRLGQPLRRSARLNPTAMCVGSPGKTGPFQLTLYNGQDLPLLAPLPHLLRTSGRSLQLCEHLRRGPSHGQKLYIQNIQQIINILPKTADPDSRFALRAHITPAGHPRMRDSLRTALWWLLPKDGDFRRASNGLHYYLERQGRRVILRGGNVTSPLHESRLRWLHDPPPPATTSS